MELIYREGTHVDVDGIYRLICILESQQLDTQRFFRIFHKNMDDPDHVCLVCEADGKVIGVMHMRLEEQQHHADWVAEILELSVDPEYRGRRIGKELLARAVACARERGCEVIELTSNNRRKDAHRFYQREGMNCSHVKFTYMLK